MTLGVGSLLHRFFKYVGLIWYASLNTCFQFLNNITRNFYTFFHPHVFKKKKKKEKETDTNTNANTATGREREREREREMLFIIIIIVVVVVVLILISGFRV